MLKSQYCQQQNILLLTTHGLEACKKDIYDVNARISTSLNNQQILSKINLPSAPRNGVKCSTNHAGFY